MDFIRCFKDHGCYIGHCFFQIQNDMGEMIRKRGKQIFDLGKTSGARGQNFGRGRWDPDVIVGLYQTGSNVVNVRKVFVQQNIQGGIAWRDAEMLRQIANLEVWVQNRNGFCAILRQVWRNLCL